MSFHHQQIAPPKAWDEFEDLCLALFRAEWQDSAAQKNGRQGQADAGVDVFGRNYAQDGGWWGVQCKCKNIGIKLSKKIIDAELIKADTFVPKLAHWVIATTAANDAPLQKYARTLSAQRVANQLCPVDVFFWDSIEALLHKHRDVAKIYYPDHFVQLNPPVKPLRLPAISLSAYFADPANHLEKLRQQLQTKGSSALLAAATVQGMGGVGKTQLALKYCLQFQDEYAGVWWLQAETASLLEQECILFCHKQGLALVPGESASAAMCTWLNGQTGWLLVYDNVDDVKLVRACLPQAGKHHVLITSRLRGGWAGMAKMELDVWEDEQALQFLHPRLADVVGVPDARDDAQLRLLTHALDGLPLALEQACAYIEQNQVTVAAYCQRIQAHDSAQRLLVRSDSEFCPRSVLATLSLAFEKLSEPALLLLGVCAWLAAEPIPEYLFTEIPAKWEDELASDLPPALQTLAADEFAWRETVDELKNYALCKAQVSQVADHVGNGAEEVRCLNFHRLTQAAVRASVHGAQTGAAALVLVQAAFPIDTNQPKHWPRCRTLAQHVQRLQACYQQSWQQAVRYARLLAQFATYLKYAPALYQQTKSLAREAWLIQQNALGEEHPETLISINILAEALQQMGELHSARTLQEKVLAIRRRVLGEEHPNTMNSINNLALTLLQMGELSGARTLQEKELEICCRVLGGEHPDTLISMSNMATTLGQMGDLPGARTLHEMVLKIRQRVLGESHPATLQSINNLAVTRYELGELPGAQSLMEQAITILSRICGEEHPHTLRSKQNLTDIIAAQKTD